MRGFADIHAHPMAHLAFGGHMIWGEPSGPIEHALRSCNGTNHEAHSRIDFPFLVHDDVAKEVLDGLAQSERESSWRWRTWIDQPDDHPHDGFPTFRGWPQAGSMSHQLFHVDWLRRAYEGGLRLMSCLTVNNRLIAWLMENGRECWDDETVCKQADEMRRIATEPSNARWMEIAYSSADAERIIQSDKLAIVLGVEVDQIELFLSHDPAELARLDIEAALFLGGKATSAPRIARLAQTIYDVGIRQITPLHFANNMFGGSALYLDRHSSNIRWLNLWSKGLPASDDDWPQVVAAPANSNLEFRLQKMQLPPNRGWSIWHPPLGDATAVEFVDAGHVNGQDLTFAGKVFLMELWRRGILVDIDHMSMKTKESALALAEHFGVPVISSHCWVSEIVLSREEIGMPDDWWKAWDGKTPTTRAQPTWPMLRHEGMRSDRDLERIKKLGGITASILRQPAVHKPKELTGVDADGVDNMGTTTAAAAAYLHIVDVLGMDAAVGIGTDINGLAQLPTASSCCCCSPSLDPYGPSGMRRSVAGDRTFDINSDGMAHYGMLPDLFARWRAEGVTVERLEPLYRSAEGYVETWSRAEEVAKRPRLFDRPPP